MHFISIFSILVIYCIILQLVRMHQKINIPVHHYLFFPYVCYILFILEYLTKSNN